MLALGKHGRKKESNQTIAFRMFTIAWRMADFFSPGANFGDILNLEQNIKLFFQQIITWETVSILISPVRGDQI